MLIDIKPRVDIDTSSDTTEEWNPIVEVIDIKPMNLNLPSEIDSVEELLRSSDHTDEETVNCHKLQLPYVDMSRSKVERIVDRKKKRRKKVSEDKWKITEEEEDWVPAKVKRPVRIVLTKKRQDVSNDEEEEKITQTKDRSHSPFKEQNWVVRAKREQEIDRTILELKREVSRYEREERRISRNNLMLTTQEEEMLTIQKEKMLTIQKEELVTD